MLIGQPNQGQSYSANIPTMQICLNEMRDKRLLLNYLRLRNRKEFTLIFLHTRIYLLHNKVKQSLSKDTSKLQQRLRIIEVSKSNILSYSSNRFMLYCLMFYASQMENLTQYWLF